jgi:hypothetical protein
MVCCGSTCEKLDVLVSLSRQGARHVTDVKQVECIQIGVQSSLSLCADGMTKFIVRSGERDRLSVDPAY